MSETDTTVETKESKATYRTNAVEAAMKLLKRKNQKPLTRSEINEKVGEIDGASDKSHKVAGEVNDAEFAGRIVLGHYFVRPARGVYSAVKAPDGLENAAELAAEFRANAKAAAEAAKVEAAAATNGDGDDEDNGEDGDEDNS